LLGYGNSAKPSICDLKGLVNFFNKPISILLHEWSLAVCGIRWHFGSKKLGFLLFLLTEVLSLVSSLLDESRLTREIAP